MSLSTREISYGQGKQSFQQLAMNLQKQTYTSPQTSEMHISKQNNLNDQLQN